MQTGKFTFFVLLILFNLFKFYIFTFVRCKYFFVFRCCILKNIGFIHIFFCSSEQTTHRAHNEENNSKDYEEDKNDDKKQEV